MYATLAQVKEYLGVTGATDDALLSRLIDAAGAAIDAHCGRSFVASAPSTARAFSIDRWARDVIFLTDDLRVLNSVTTDAGDSYTAAQFTFPVPSRVLFLKSGTPQPSADARFVTVTGTWGYTASPPDDVRQACIRLAGYYYRAKDAQAYDVLGMTETGVMRVSAEMPRDVRDILSPYVAGGIT